MEDRLDALRPLAPVPDTVGAMDTAALRAVWALLPPEVAYTPPAPKGVRGANARTSARWG